MHGLETPDAAPGLDLEADQALGEEVVAGPMAAVEVGRHGVGRQIDVAQFGVGAHRRPHRDLAGIAPRVALPAVVAVLARLRHRVERPQQLAGAHVVAAHPPGDLLLLRDQRRNRRRRDDDVADDDRRRLHRVGERVQVVARSANRARQTGHQIDAAALAEALDETSAVRVDRHQVAVAGAPQHPRVAAVVPVGDAALIPAQAHRRGAGFVALGVVRPERATGRGVERRADRRRGVEEQHATDHQRCRLEVGEHRRSAIAPPLRILAVELGEHVLRRAGPLPSAGQGDAQSCIR